jgi:hypothetical protein
MTWTQAICAACYAARVPDGDPIVLRDPDPERCCDCGAVTTDGIYLRIDPATVQYPRGRQ